MPAIEVSGLVKDYGTVRAVDGISFTVHEGEIFGLLGPNGAGKTTTMEILEGLRRPTSGRIEVAGFDVVRQPNEVKRRIGVQLQATALFDLLTVRETIALYAQFVPNPRPVDEVMRELALEEKASTYAKDLSGGQKQRLSIAIALVNDPQIVFLDEPTTGLDPQARRNLWDTIRALKEKGKTVVLSTHYMDEAQELCDRLLVIDHGKVIAEGSPQELIRRHFDASIVEFRVGELLDDRRAAQLGALLGQDGAVRGPEVSAQVQDVPGVLARLFTWATEAGVSVSELAVRTASLEDLFLKLTGRSLRE